MLKKLRLKFVLINMSIVTAMLMVIFFLVYFMTRSNLETESFSMMQAVSENPFSLDNPADGGDQVQLPYFTVQLNPMGDVISTGGGYYDLSDEEYLEELVEAVLAENAAYGTLESYGLRYYRAETAARTQNIVFADLSYETATLQDLLKTSVLIGVLAFFALLGASILLARWAVKPVETAWDRQKKFMADASHELKTPLTVITTSAEMIENTGGDEEEIRRLNQNILTMSRQMRSLVEKLLEIARVDDGAEKMEFADVDFSDLVTEASLQFEVLFFEKGYHCEAQIEEGIIVNGSAEHLNRVVEILLDNAGKYTSPEGRISLTLVRQGRKHCRLTVSTDGAALSAEECEAIFGRFYRGDEARSRTGSFGLGLSIAQSIVTAHHGRIYAKSEEGRNHFIAELSAQEAE